MLNFLKQFYENILNSLIHYYENIDKIFTLNFTLLAFIITAITILLMIEKGMINKFKNANLLEEAMDYFYKSLRFNFFSGTYALIIWFININEKTHVYYLSFISFILLSISLYYIYQSYKFLIFFVQKQNK